MKLDGLTLKQLEAKQRSRRFSRNFRKRIGVNYDEVQNELDQVETKINEIKGDK